MSGYSAKFGTGTGETLVEAKMLHTHYIMYSFLSSTSVPFRPTTVQMPNLALVETKRTTSVPVLITYYFHTISTAAQQMF